MLLRGPVKSENVCWDLLAPHWQLLELPLDNATLDGVLWHDQPVEFGLERADQVIQICFEFNRFTRPLYPFLPHDLILGKELLYPFFLYLKTVQVIGLLMREEARRFAQVSNNLAA